MKNLSLLFLLFLVTVSSNAQIEKRVCFLGNSYTTWFNLSGVVSQMATLDGNTLIKDVHAPGGYSLNLHSTNSTSLEKIKTDEWDFVVLQDQSTYPASEWEVLNEVVFPAAARISDSIRDANACAIPLFYQTWGRRDGGTWWDSIDTFTKMNQRLYESYEFMAEQNSGMMAPIGIAFEHIANDADAPMTHFELYNPDGSHPSAFGSYLAACIFYEIIFETSSVGNPFLLEDITEAEAAYLQNVATTVLNENDTISIDFTQPIPDYEVDYDGLTATFTNTSLHAFEYHWNFGDGNTSSEENPVHTYASEGDYEVILTAIYCGREGINIDGVDHTTIEEYENIDFSIYPNPSHSGYFTIETNGEQGFFEIFNLAGKQVLVSKTALNQSIYLDPGVYLVRVNGTSKKLIIQ